MSEEKQATPGDRYRIDVHHHYVPPAYIAEVMANVTPKKRKSMPPLLNWTPEKTLEDMDKGGTVTAILSITTPGLWFRDNEVSRHLARTCNEYAARMKTDHPDRFGLWVALPLPDIDGSLREIEYGLD